MEERQMDAQEIEGLACGLGLACAALLVGIGVGYVLGRRESGASCKETRDEGCGKGPRQACPQAKEAWQVIDVEARVMAEAR